MTNEIVCQSFVSLTAAASRDTVSRKMWRVRPRILRPFCWAFLGETQLDLGLIYPMDPAQDTPSNNNPLAEATRRIARRFSTWIGPRRSSIFSPRDSSKRPASCTVLTTAPARYKPQKMKHFFDFKTFFFHSSADEGGSSSEVPSADLPEDRQMSPLEEGSSRCKL